MHANKVERPPIPAQFYEPSLLKVFLFFVFAASFLIIPGVVTVTITKSSLNSWIKVLTCMPLIIIASHSFHLFGWFAHEGIHLSLFRNKYLSMAVGILVSGIAFFPAIGYGITHWNHHRFTNQESDPDTKIYPRYRTFWQRFFFARLLANRGYTANTVTLVFERPLDKKYRLPFTDAEQRDFAFLTLLSMAMWFSTYVLICYLDPVVGIIGIILPFICNIPFSGLRIYLEHNSTGDGIFNDTRSYISPFYTVLMFGNNMHLEHHLYPRVPCYNLPKVHRYLSERGYYAKWNSHIVPGILAPLKFVGSSHQYPDPLLPDLINDPFAIDIPSPSVSPRHRN